MDKCNRCSQTSTSLIIIGWHFWLYVQKPPTKSIDSRRKHFHRM
ncbi:DUF3624 family protein [Nostoc sp. LEGE 06077]|nr:DUF3624 family protein [Nostoc sp. LEGE 06077]